MTRCPMCLGEDGFCTLCEGSKVVTQGQADEFYRQNPSDIFREFPEPTYPGQEYGLPDFAAADAAQDKITASEVELMGQAMLAQQHPPTAYRPGDDPDDDPSWLPLICYDSVANLDGTCAFVVCWDDYNTEPFLLIRNVDGTWRNSSGETMEVKV